MMAKSKKVKQVQPREVWEIRVNMVVRLKGTKPKEWDGPWPGNMIGSIIEIWYEEEGKRTCFAIQLWKWSSRYEEACRKEDVAPTPVTCWREDFDVI
jgi:hypothetical protein